MVNDNDDVDDDKEEEDIKPWLFCCKTNRCKVLQLRFAVLFVVVATATPYDDDIAERRMMKLRVVDERMNFICDCIFDKLFCFCLWTAGKNDGDVKVVSCWLFLTSAPVLASNHSLVCFIVESARRLICMIILLLLLFRCFDVSVGLSVKKGRYGGFGIWNCCANGT